MAASRSLGSLTLDLIANIGGFSGALDKAGRDADRKLSDIEKRAYEFGEKIGDTFKTAAAALGIGFTADKFIESLKESINVMDELSKSAQRVGTSVESFSSLSYAASLADVSIEDLQGSLGKLIKSQAAALDSNSKQAKVFDALGISVKNADGTLRDSTDVLKDFADRFQELHGSPEAIAAGMQLFGKSFQTLIPLLKDGAAGISDAQEEADALNQTIGKDSAEAAENFNDNLTRLQAAVKGVFNEVAENLLPALVEYTDDAVDVAKANNNVKDTGDDVTSVLEALGAVVAAGAIAWDALHASIQATTTFAAGSVDVFQGIGKILAHTFTFGQLGPAYKDAMQQIQTAGQVTDQGIVDASNNLVSNVKRDADTLKKLINGTILDGIVPKGKLKGAADSFIGDVFGTDAANDAAAKKMSDRLQGVLGNADANAAKAKKQADALADAYSKLNEAVQKTSDSADPTNKAYNDYATTVRNIDRLGADVIEKGGSVIQVQDAVAKAVDAAQKKLATDLAAPMKAAEAYNQALDEQLQATKALIDSKVSAIGMGTKEAANQNELAQVYANGTKAIADFQKQRELHPNSMTDEQYNTELSGLKKYWGDVYDVTKDGQDKITAAQADWTNGVSKAFKDFYDEQSNLAGISEQLTKGFLDNASSDLADFIDGTKSAKDALKDFINSFETMISQAVSKQLLKQLFDLGGNSGGSSGGGSMGSIFDLFGSGSFSYFASGGSPGAHSVSRVNENGPELLTVGGKDYLMMGDQPGIVRPNSSVGSAGDSGSRAVNQYNSFSFAAPTSMKTQNQMANRAALLQRQAARLG